MQNIYINKTASHYFSTHPGVMTCSFLIISVFLGLLFHKLPDGSIKPWQAYFLCSLFDIGALYYMIKWMHTIRFTERELVFCRLGKPYRKLSWDKIIQVGVAKEYKAAKLTLVLTPQGTPVYDCSYPTTTIYVERYRRRLILLDATEDNLAVISQLYGKLDYEAKHL